MKNEIKEAPKGKETEVTVINRRNHPVTILYKGESFTMSPNQRATLIQEELSIPEAHKGNILVSNPAGGE